ncbi:SDR family oxidoreductase [Promicromonospora thailandica]|uniref:Short-chain dehydrogenase n=1 Tax=Promicromonospora thailandica TaxID=765201 RepID=A0A9X2JUA4_9MICO|nr:SDR family oxidoreductase [Promicromonospora thailandica]MCP2262818.1 Short-chain dehydrogenase [Promicromonospora thailandica]BFF18150.1 SDR family oxidoreductase [Promicromonospora thailandica]
MDIKNSVALVTGANRGLGRAFAQRLLDRGARKVYATARRPETVDLPGVEVLALDVTDPASVRAAAQAASDVTLLVNNAGISTGAGLVTGSLDDVRFELETNMFGSLATIRELAPALAANDGGAIVNVLSAMSWFGVSGANAYHLAKGAAWAMTNGVRLELAEQGTLVTAVHLGLADTDMAAGMNVAKIAPADLADAALDGVEAGSTEVLADQWSRDVKSWVQLAPEDRDAQIARGLAAMAGA